MISPGLAALVEHVQTLRADVVLLLEHERHRSARILDNLVDEEAAKVLILLDLVRHGVADDAVVTQQVRHFYDHVARGIYAAVSVGAPASFREQRERAEALRVSLYLDGPHDVDWIFRNEIESGREDAMYVDYVVTDEGTAWWSPASSEFPMWGPSIVSDLVLSLHRLGATSAAGLRAVEDVWRGRAPLADDAHWSVMREINFAVLQRLRGAGLAGEEQPQDAAKIVDGWLYPMGSLDLRKVKISRADLLAEQEVALEAMERDFYGD